MSDNLCSRGIYGCRHDEGHIPTKDTVLKYFADRDGYVLSKDLNNYFGCCTRERTDALSSILTHMQYVSEEIKHLPGGAWGLVGSEHPKIQKQKQILFKEMPPGKIHLRQDGVMIHDRDGILPYDYVITEDVDEVTCGTCLQILRAREKS